MDIKAEFASTDSSDCVKQEEFFHKLEQDDSLCSDDDDTCLSASSKKISKRKKYQKIDNDIRLKIIEEVQKNGKLLKNAAEKYNVNYSSAKSIFHVYRKEGRILKKPFKGRASKTIVQLNNPIVFVNLPASQTSSAEETTQPAAQQQQRWQQLPPIQSLTLGAQANKDPQIVSIVHPKSGSVFHNVYSQGYPPVIPQQQGLVMQDISNNPIAIERKMMMENYVKINSHDIAPVFNYPFFAIQQHHRQMYYSNDLHKDVQLGKNGSYPLNKAFLFRQMMQNQWNTIQ